MKFATKLLSGAALAIALSNTAFANTYQILNTAGNYQFDLTLTTAADATSAAQTVTAVSGTFNGVTVYGLGTATANTFLADPSANKWFGSGSNAFSLTLGNLQTVTLYTAFGNASIQVHDYATMAYLDKYATYSGSVVDKTPPSTTATAVPEPEAYAMMLAGLGLIGFAARRKQAA